MRTAEQKEADDALTEAIEAVDRAYKGDHNRIAAEYMVIASYLSWDDEGDGETALSLIFRDGDIPFHRAIGLAAYAKAKLLSDITELDDE